MNNRIRKAFLLSALIVAILFILALVGCKPAIIVMPVELQELKSVEAKASGLDDQQPTNWERHDPSNIIKHEGKYLLWVTEHRKGTGFLDCRIILLSSPDGLDWTFEQIALDRNPAKAWDDSGVLTSYVVPHENKYYLFYTGVSSEFKSSQTSRRGMGYAVSDSPYGPWKRPPSNQILLPGEKGAWDELCVDDANILRRGDRWHFYFKGRAMNSEPGESQVGYAISDNLTGPYEKYEANPLFHGHAFTVTKYGDGLLALPGAHNKYALWSSDGIDFTKGAAVNHKSTGVYNPADFEADSRGVPVEWFIDVVPGFPRVLRRVDLQYETSGEGE